MFNVDNANLFRRLAWWRFVVLITDYDEFYYFVFVALIFLLIINCVYVDE